MDKVNGAGGYLGMEWKNAEDLETNLNSEYESEESEGIVNRREEAQEEGGEKFFLSHLARTMEEPRRLGSLRLESVSVLWVINVAYGALRIC